MRSLLIVLFNVAVITSYGQDIKGTLYDYATKKPVKLSYKSDTPRIYFDSQHQKSSYYSVDKDGHFNIPAKDIEKWGKSVNLSISQFNTDNMDNDFADIEIKNIPVDSLQMIVSKLFLTRVYWMTHGGNDNYFINNRKTFSKSFLIVNNGLVKYYMKRHPQKMKKMTLGVEYITDFNFDVLK